MSSEIACPACAAVEASTRAAAKVSVFMRASVERVVATRRRL
jgi:hypothetical protein